MLRIWMSSVAFLPFIVFNKPDEGASGGTPPAGQGDDQGNQNDGTLPAGGAAASGTGDGDAGGDDGADGAGDGSNQTGGDGAGDGSLPAAGATPPVDWRDREINRKHRQLQDERRERERIQRELEDARALLARQGGGTGDPPADGGPGTARAAAPAAPLTPDAIQREARKIVAQQTYNEQCNKVYEDGGKEYKGKWDDALKTLTVLGGLGENEEGVENMTAVLAADNPAAVLYTLGSNPDEYHRVMALPPAKRMAEFVKLGMKKEPKPAPKPQAGDPPVEPLTRRARVDNSEPSDEDDDATWHAKRDRQRRERWEARQAGRRVSA